MDDLAAQSANGGLRDLLDEFPSAQAMQARIRVEILAKLGFDLSFRSDRPLRLEQKPDIGGRAAVRCRTQWCSAVANANGTGTIFATLFQGAPGCTENSMLNLNYVYYFVQVVDKNGFSAAGKALNIPKSSLSRRISELETQLGARLIQRTSRTFVVTEAGREFYEHGQAMLAEAEAAEQSVKRRIAEPQGAIRVTCTVPIAQFVVADLLPKFAMRFPKVDIIQHATNRYVDLVSEGFDLALRAHSQPLPDSSLISRPIASTPWGLFASQRYVNDRGAPIDPKDLADHVGLQLNDIGNDRCWRLYRRSKAEQPINFKPRVCSDDMITLKKSAESGLGIVALPTYLCRADVRDKKLVRILPEWTAGSGIITLLAPSRRGLLPSVRAFSDFLAAEFPAAVASDGDCS